MLTAPNHLFLHVFENGFQDYLLHHLHRPKVRLSSPVIPWILLEDGINIYLLTGSKALDFCLGQK